MNDVTIICENLTCVTILLDLKFTPSYSKMSLQNETHYFNQTLSPSSLVLTLNEVKVKFIYYLPLILILSGLVGFVGNLFTYLQPNLRSNSFCIYTLGGSLIDVINLLVNLLPNYLNPVNGNLVSTISNRFLCKLKLLALVFLPQLSMNLLIMSLIDRYVCTLRLTSVLRHLLKIKAVPWSISITVIMSILMSLYAPILHDVIDEFGCVSTNPTLNGIAYILIHGIITPCTMAIIVVFTYRRFKNNRRRVVTIFSFSSSSLLFDSSLRQLQLPFIVFEINSLPWFLLKHLPRVSLHCHGL